MNMDISPLWISLKVAFTSTFITFFTGIFFARLIKSMKRFRFIPDCLLTLPMVLPPTVVGFFLLIIFGKNSSVGSLLESIGLRVVFTWQGAVIAAIVVSFPIMYRSALSAFDQVDSELIDAAKTLGFGEAAIFFKVWIPLSWPGLASGAILSFARALGEFGATIMIAGNLPGKTRTMSVAVYTAMQSGNRQAAYMWVILILGMSVVTLLIMNYWSSRQYNKEDGSGRKHTVYIKLEENQKDR